MNNEHKVKVISHVLDASRVSQISELGVVVKSLLQTVTVFLMSRPPNDVLSALPPLTIPFSAPPVTALLVVHLHIFIFLLMDIRWKFILNHPDSRYANFVHVWISSGRGDLLAICLSHTHVALSGPGLRVDH